MDHTNLDAFTRAVHDSFRNEDPVVTMKLLEETHVRSVQRMFDALGRSDLDGFLEEMHPAVEIEIHAPPEFPWTRRARGREEFRALVQHNFATLAGQATELLNVVAQGNLVVLVARERGRLREPDTPYAVHFTYEFTFRDDKVSRIRELVASSS